MSEGAEGGAPSPLLTLPVSEALFAARDAGTSTLECSLDLGLSSTRVNIEPMSWNWNQQRFPYIAGCKDRSVYRWTGASFEPISRYGTSLIKLVPTPWGPPTFEIDGIKMLPTARVSPYEDAMHKVALIEPRGKVDSRYLRGPRVFRRMVPARWRGARAFVRKEPGRALAAKP